MGGIVRKYKNNENNTHASLKKTDSNVDFTTECLRKHNVYRQQHGVPPLTISKKMCLYSEEWAKHLAQKGVVEPRPNCEYGENIFCMTCSDAKYQMHGSEPVDCWYSEERDHDFDREPKSLTTGHFTQVIWRESKKMGVAFAKNKKTGQIFVVANYSPAGNYPGGYEENVFPTGE